MTEIEIVGPRVTVDRDDTSDRGGGRLVLSGGKLCVRATSMERELGLLSAVSDIRVVDLARQQARVRFVDGAVWNVVSETGEDIYDFLKQLERSAGRPGLVAPPPRLSQAVREAATPQRWRWTLMAIVALAMFFPVRMLAGLSAPVGHVLALIALVLLGIVIVAIGLREGGPAMLEGVRARLARLGPMPVVALLIAVAAGAALGAGDAETRLREASEKRFRTARAEQKARAQQTRIAAEEATRTRGIEAAVAKLDAQLAAGRLEDARRTRERLRALDPDHAGLARAAAALDGVVAPTDEAGRVAGLETALQAVRGMARDRLRCEDAREVSSTWRQLSAARTSDERYAQVLRAVKPLERCRQRVAARFAASAADGRRNQRMQMAPAIEAQLRALGYPASVKLEGKRLDRLAISAGELDAAAVVRITALTDADGVSFLDKRATEGVRAVVFRGDKFDKRFEVQPVSTQTLTEPLLDRFGLARPLELGAAPEAPAAPGGTAQ